ncbi:hypothetical protein [Nocardia testacea]|uniref:hypothetical protein n=1 Tax=Nocardia testacea TaxID=248551 RepID=UPI00030793B5|nr:hypothetical protein [Nocardia testacea]
MSTAAAAIDAVLQAITNEASHGPATRLEALARTLDSLSGYLTGGISGPVLTNGPMVVPVSAPDVAYLEGFIDNAVIVSQTDASIWERTGAFWYTTGSDAGLTSNDLAARGPWRVIRHRAN